MSEPIAASLAAISSNLSPGMDPASSATKTAFFYDPSLSAAGQEPGVASEFQNILKSFHSEVSSYDAEKNKPLASSSGADPVRAAKDSFYPQGDGKIHAANEANAVQDPVAAANDKQTAASKMLKSSFDHALFVTLVSQVVSGVGQTVSTLIKQQ